MAKI
jgi:hypothetical protein